MRRDAPAPACAPELVVTIADAARVPPAPLHAPSLARSLAELKTPGSPDASADAFRFEAPGLDAANRYQNRTFAL